MSDTHDQQVEKGARAITDKWPWTDVPALADEIARAVLDAVSPRIIVYDCAHNNAQYAQPCDRCPADPEAQQ